MKVVDASAMVEVLMGTTRGSKVLVFFDDDLFAPDALITETWSALKRMTTSRVLTRAQADELAGALQQARIEYMHVWPYAQRMWNMSDSFSVYDAAYVALAHDLGAPLLTTDSRLARSAADIVQVITV